MKRLPSARTLVRLAGGAWLLSLAVIAAAVYGPGERLWPVSVFLFGPRRALLLPLVVLLPAAARFDRWSLGPLLAGAALSASPIFGLNVPWDRLLEQDRPGPALRLASWNAGGGGVRPEDVAALVREEAPDVLALQECPGGVETPEGWQGHGVGGMVLLSRLPILDAAVRRREEAWEREAELEVVRYTLDTPLGRVDLTNVHLETPREGLKALRSAWAGVPALEARTARRELGARRARAFADAGTAALRLVAGDFNTPVESHLFREHWSGLRDCHSAAGWGFGFTKRTRVYRTRIDHVLAGPGLECVSARTGRFGEGDHAPVIVEVRRAGS